MVGFLRIVCGVSKINKSPMKERNDRATISLNGDLEFGGVPLTKTSSKQETAHSASVDPSIPLRRSPKSPSKFKAFVRHVVLDIWKEQPVWTVAFLAICAFWAAVMWVQSGRLPSNPNNGQLMWIRLAATITLFVLPSLFYGFYTWWMRRR